MCGVAGLLAQHTNQPSSEILERMLRSLYHRGPDEDGRLIDGPLAMGMRRLSIVDLADGTQPIFDESGRYSVVFNGQIYNYRELREQLLSRGHQLKTHSDTETIVHLFEEHRENCLEHLRGMFALAVWDSQRRELFLARDRTGIKPLYYTIVDGELIFASEIKAILQHPAVKREVDTVAMSQYLSFGAFLIGGLDSSTIVALMAEQLSGPVKTFSVGCSGPGLQDELPYAQQVSDAFGCEHHTLKISSHDFFGLAEKVLFHLDQPIAVQATIATYMVAKLARQHVKMVLTGEGGDELMQDVLSEGRIEQRGYFLPFGNNSAQSLTGGCL